MASTILLSDNGASSGSAGIKTTGGNDGTLLLQTTTSGGTATTALAIDTSQNVGIGATVNAGWSTSYGKIIQLNTNNFLVGEGSSGSLDLGNNAYYNGTNWIYATTAGASLYQQYGGAHIWRYSASGTAGTTASMSEAARIDSSGNLLVGTTSNPNSSKMLVTGSSTASAVTSAAEFRIGGSGENGGQILLQNIYSGATNINKWLRVSNVGSLQIVNSAYNSVPLDLTDGGNLTITGATATKASGTTWANPSDQRLKNNIRDYEKGLAELMQVRVREWEYNGKGGTTEGMKGLGVIADEVMTVLPNTVENYDAKLNADDKEKTAIKKFDATEITWLLVKAIQEQQALITSLTARIAALENK
jgi:hypothetical protein